MRTLGQNERSVYIYKVAKSYGFSFGQEKIKLNLPEAGTQKALASCADGNKKFPYYRTTLSPTVSHHLTKNEIIQF